MKIDMEKVAAPLTRWITPKAAVLTVVLLLSAWGAMLRLRETPVDLGRGVPGTAAEAAAMALESAVSEPRLVYPYSVVPGGVLDVNELEAAVAGDPVVREHYRGLNLRNARLDTLEADRYAYVSYRIKNTVYWTKNKLKLAKGEKVITDGVNTLRTRCGNRLSDAPMAMVSPLEPPEVVFDSPILPAPLRALSTPQPSVEVSEGPPVEIVAPPPPVILASSTPAPSPMPWGGFFPAPLSGGGAPPGTPPGTPPPGPPSGPPPTTPPVDPPGTPPSVPPTTPPGTPPGTPPSVPPATPPGNPPATPPGTPPGTPPSNPPGTPPAGPPTSPPGTPPVQPPGTPSSPPPQGPPGTPPSTPPGTPPVEPPPPPPSFFEPPPPEGPFPPPPPPPADDPSDPDPPDPLAPPEIPPPPPTPIPEPSTYLMMGAGLAVLLGFHRRRKRSS
jgi:hypothetical protein